MTQEEIKSFAKKFKLRFKYKHLVEIQQWLIDASDEDLKKIKKSVKSPFILNLYAFFGGFLALDRFILGQPFLGFLKILSFWPVLALALYAGIPYVGFFAGIWQFIDWCTAANRTKNYNYKKVIKVLGKIEYKGVCRKSFEE
jgi:TM2 domain-containing membrane protein YozV